MQKIHLWQPITKPGHGRGRSGHTPHTLQLGYVSFSLRWEAGTLPPPFHQSRFFSSNLLECCAASFIRKPIFGLEGSKSGLIP